MIRIFRPYAIKKVSVSVGGGHAGTPPGFQAIPTITINLGSTLGKSRVNVFAAAIKGCSEALLQRVNMRKPFFIYTAAALFIAGALESPPARRLCLSDINRSQRALSGIESGGGVVYVGGKTQVFVGCRAEAEKLGDDLQHNSILSCMKARGYTGWCVKNSMCFEADRLDTKLSETIARLL
jgi:hypothetical protein